LSSTIGRLRAPPPLLLKNVIKPCLTSASSLERISVTDESQIRTSHILIRSRKSNRSCHRLQFHTFSPQSLVSRYLTPLSTYFSLVYLQVFEFYEELLSVRYPYSCYKQVFVDMSY